MRNSGRTSIMLHRAVANALEGKDVMVVAATKEQACQMFKRVADMQTPQKAHYPRLVLEYGEGRMRFVANTRDQVNERGFSGIVATDHYVLESLVQDHGPCVDNKPEVDRCPRCWSGNREWKAPMVSVDHNGQEFPIECRDPWHAAASQEAGRGTEEK